MAVHGFALTLAPIFFRISSVLCSQTQPFRGFAFFAKVSFFLKKKAPSLSAAQGHARAAPRETSYLRDMPGTC